MTWMLCHMHCIFLSVDFLCIEALCLSGVPSRYVSLSSGLPCHPIWRQHPGSSNSQVHLGRQPIRLMSMCDNASSMHLLECIEKKSILNLKYRRQQPPWTCCSKLSKSLISFRQACNRFQNSFGTPQQCLLFFLTFIYSGGLAESNALITFTQLQIKLTRITTVRSAGLPMLGLRALLKACSIIINLIWFKKRVCMFTSPVFPGMTECNSKKNFRGVSAKWTLSWAIQQLWGRLVMAESFTRHICVVHFYIAVRNIIVVQS